MLFKAFPGRIVRSLRAERAQGSEGDASIEGANVTDGVLVPGYLVGYAYCGGRRCLDVCSLGVMCMLVV